MYLKVLHLKIGHKNDASQNKPSNTTSQNEPKGAKSLNKL